MDGWRRWEWHGGVLGGKKRGDKRAIEGGNSRQNLAIKAENLREEG